MQYFRKKFRVLISTLLPHWCKISKPYQGRRHPERGPWPLHFFCVAVRKMGKQREKRKSFKAETIRRLSPSSKCYCFSHSRASRIKKFSLPVNHGVRQYFSVFHCPSTLKCTLPALHTYRLSQII